jgi:hypothetical protein
MATPLTPLYRQYHQRTLITGIAATVVAVIVVFLIHDLYNEFLARTFGLGDRSIDTLMTLCGLLLFVAVQQSISRVLYHDVHMGIDSQLKDERPPLPLEQGLPARRDARVARDSAFQQGPRRPVA